MNHELLSRLDVITEEEKAILSGHKEVDRTLYYSPEKVKNSEVIDSSMVLRNGKLIDIRPHVRFVHFPLHTHNFVELVYMCQGKTTHLIDGNKIELKEGDFLFLNQHAKQEILPAGRDDIAVNFMILPAFFDTAFRMLGQEDSALRSFLVSCLTETDRGGNYLYFNVSGILPVQNLAENLIWVMMSDDPNKRTLAENTLGLLFLHLTQYADRISLSGTSFEEKLMIRLLSYIESEYRTAVLREFAEENGLDIYSLSRIIKKATGKTFRDLLAQKRISQACFYLRNSDLSVDDIAAAVGYENTSFFHRLFRRETGLTPREYRLCKNPVI
ncbi:AraC-type DNA-binding protein [Lachnospiraceae bacterium]|nr:AraC-type DNA-binding protein [Lachnospiraceae bacterium]